MSGVPAFPVGGSCFSCSSASAPRAMAAGDDNEARTQWRRSPCISAFGSSETRAGELPARVSGNTLDPNRTELRARADLRAGARWRALK